MSAGYGKDKGEPIPKNPTTPKSGDTKSIASRKSSGPAKASTGAMKRK